MMGSDAIVEGDGGSGNGVLVSSALVLSGKAMVADSAAVLSGGSVAMGGWSSNSHWGRGNGRLSSGRVIVL